MAICATLLFQSIEAQEPDSHMPLTLQDAIFSTLRYQPTIQISEEQINLEKGLWEIATGAFNPTVSASLSELIQRHMQTALGFMTGFHGHTTTTNFGLSGTLRAGTAYSLAYNNTQTINPVTIPLLNPRLDSSKISFTISQPLLNNFLYGVQAMTEQSDRLNVEAAALSNIQNVASSLLTTINAYWTLVGTLELRDVQREMVDLLSKILGAAEALVREKQQGEAQLHQPRGQLASAFQALESAEESVINNYYALLSAMGTYSEEAAEVSQFEFDRFVATDELYTPLTQRWLTTYMSNLARLRPDIVSQKVIIESINYLLTGAKNSLLPTLNVSLNASFPNTLAGSRAEHYASSSNFGRAEQDVTFGVNLSYPLGNDVARGSVMQQRASKHQATATYHNLILQAQANLQVVYATNNYLLEQLIQAETAEREYRSTVEVELRKLQFGLSDYFTVLQLQQDWLNVSQTRITLQVLFFQNLAQIRLITGTMIMWERGDLCYEISNVTQYPPEHFTWQPYGFRPWRKMFNHCRDRPMKRCKKEEQRALVSEQRIEEQNVEEQNVEEQSEEEQNLEEQ